MKTKMAFLTDILDAQGKDKTEMKVVVLWPQPCNVRELM